MFVPRDFTMNPETDELFLDSTRLQNGMRVLIYDHNWRASINSYSGQPVVHPGGSPDVPMATALKYNRWTTITQLRSTNERVVFVGLYPDGQQLVFDVLIKTSWYVKKDTITEIYTPDDYSVGFEAGKLAGLAEALEKIEQIRKNSYNQGYVDASKRQPAEWENKTLAERLNLNPPSELMSKLYKLPFNQKFSGWPQGEKSDLEILGHIMTKATPEGLKHLDKISVSPELLDEAVEEEQSGAVIRDVASSDESSDEVVTKVLTYETVDELNLIKLLADEGKSFTEVKDALLENRKLTQSTDEIKG